MLQIAYAGSPKAKEKFFLENKSQDDLWLVAHIEAKRTLQNFFLEDQSTIFNKSVQRASEYWQWLFSTNCPDWRAVSESLVFTLIEQWFDESEIDVRYSNIDMFRHFFGNALPMMIAENGPLLEEWLDADGERDERLAGWFEQAKAFWEFLKEKKWIGRSWAINVLNERESIFLGSFQKYFIDLGLDLRQEEVEMILRIAKEKDVTVLIPRTSWSDRYSQNLDVYKKIILAADSEITLPEGQLTPPLQLAEFSSVLKETKAAVSQVRALLDAGVPAHRIAVLSTNIEDYWDMLREHFLVEGIPVNKKYVLRAISLPSVQGWLARLNLARTDFEQAHLETYLFSDSATAPEVDSYVQFKKEFSHIYDPDDVRKFLKLPEARESAPLTMTDFVDFIMNAWRGEDGEIPDEIVDQMAQELRPSDVFSYDLWLKYLELMISRYEVEVRAASPDGILLTNFNQADWTNLDHAFILGCEQNRLREIVANPLGGEDIARLELDLGFYLQRNENLKKEFELRWFCEKDLKSVSLYHSHSDFDGQPQIAASVWLEFENARTEKTGPPSGPTRWDAIMASPLATVQNELGHIALDKEVQDRKLALENDIQAYETVQTPPGLSLSAGSLKKLFDCPFTFYGEKILKLKDQGEFDLDVDPMFQGQVWHKIVEDIHNQYPDLELTREQLGRVYDEAARSLEVDSPLKKFWLQEKSRHLIIIQNFLDLERQWRAHFPANKTVATEAVVKGFIGTDGEAVLLSPHPLPSDSYAFNGRIDRVDQDPQGHLAVVDYKTSANKLMAFKSWPKNGQFQMPLYALALEAGLVEGFENAKVMSASYFIFKDKERGKGYILSDQEHGFGDLKEKSSQLIATEMKDSVFQALSEEIKKIFAILRQGFFPPQPRDEKICKTCQWSRVCRAPHLK